MYFLPELSDEFTCTYQVLFICVILQVDPARIVDIDFTAPRKEKKPASVLGTPKRVPGPTVPPTDSEKEQFFRSLHTAGIKSIVLSTHDEYYVDFKPKQYIPSGKKLPVQLDKKFINNSVLTPSELLEKSKEEFKHLQISEAESDYLEFVTKNQADSLAWHQHCVGNYCQQGI